MSSFPSLYPAVVTDVADPLKLGRVRTKVSVIGEDFDLEWAYPGAMAAGVGSGWYWPPDLDANVWIMFQDGDVEHPVYVGGVWSEGEVPDEFVQSEPLVRGFKSPGGHKFEVDDSDGTSGMRWTTASGIKIQMDEANGQISMITPAGHIFILDDENELFLLVSAGGAAFQMLDDGSVVVASPGGTIYLNAEDTETTVFGASGAFVKLGVDEVAVSDASGENSVALNDKGVTILASSAVTLSAESVDMQGGTVALGKGAILSSVIGEQLAALFDSHFHATPVGPSGPPLAPFTFAGTAGSPLDPLSKFVKIGPNT